MRRWRAWVIGALLMAACRRGCHEPLPPPDPAALAALPMPPSEGAFLLGINEAVAIPSKKYADEPDPERHLKADARRAYDQGARAARGHTFNFPAVSWASLQADPGAIRQMDQWVAAVQKEGLVAVAMVSPWPGNRTGNYTERYVPEDLASYRRYVRALVERYDGDGLDDMPGLLSPIRYWEIDNEPDLKNTNLPIDPVRRYNPADFCTPEQYAAVLIATSEEIRAAYPEARVLNGGLYRPAAEGTWRWMDGLLAIEGVRGAFDILSLHTYADDSERVVTGIQAMRLRLNDRPIWITETSVPSRGPEGRGEGYQARMLAAIVARAAAAGAGAVFWHNLKQPSPTNVPDDRGYGLFRAPEDGLIDAPPTEKPAGAVFRHLSALLAEHDLLAAQEGERGQVVLKDGSVILWEGKVKEHNGAIDLLTGTRVEPGRPAAAPAFLLP